MAEPTPDQAAIVRPALIVTWYALRPDVGATAFQPLIDCLESALSLQSTRADSWHNHETQGYLIRFDPAAAQDSEVLQLALNGATKTGDRGRLYLRDQLDALLAGVALPAELIGQTRIYQAELAVATPTEAQTADAPSLDDLASRLTDVVARLARTEDAPRPLAHHSDQGAHLLLYAAPSRGAEPARPALYVALNPTSDERYVSDILFGPSARLLMPDLLAHKGYHQMRQYRAQDLHHRYLEQVRALGVAAADLLADLGQTDKLGARLAVLARSYGRLANVAGTFNALHISLQRQLENLNWRRGLWPNAVLDYHIDHIQMAVQELALLAAEGNAQLAHTQIALQLLQVESDRLEQVHVREEEKREQDQARRDEENQRRWTIGLTIAGIALAIPQLVDREAAGAMLDWVGYGLFLVSGRWLLAAPPYETLYLVAAQLILIVLVSLCALGLMRLGSRRE